MICIDLCSVSGLRSAHGFAISLIDGGADDRIAAFLFRRRDRVGMVAFDLRAISPLDGREVGRRLKPQSLPTIVHDSSLADARIESAARLRPLAAGYFFGVPEC